MCLSFLGNLLGAHELIVPHIPSRDTLYLCCRTRQQRMPLLPGLVETYRFQNA